VKLDDAVVDGSASVDAILREFGDRTFGPLLTLCGIVMITPLGSIPGLPAVVSACIISISLQLIFGRTKPWLPERLRRLKISRKNIKTSQRFARPVFEKVDGFVRPRMSWAATKAARIFVAIISIFLALALLVLAALPFGGLIPGFLIVFFGLGIMARDGLILTLCFSTIILMLSPLFLT